MEKVRLCDICDFQGGSQPPKDEWSFEQKDGYIRMLQIRDFTQTRNVEKEYIKLTSSTKTCEVDDILIARYGASVGKILTGLSGAYNVAIMKTIPNKRLLNKSYLKYYLLSDYFQNRINSVGERAAQAGFNKEDLSKLFISLVSLEEQKRIADELDNVSNLIDKRKQQLSKLDELVKARFVELFGECQEHKRLEEYAALITKGASPKWQGVDYCEEGTLFVTSENVREGYLDLSKRKYLDDKINEIQPRSILKRNDILINIVGASIGRAAVYDCDEIANINQAVALVRVDYSQINQIYLMTFLNSPQAIEMYGKMKKGGARDNLSLQNIADLQIPVAPMELQNQFANFVEQTDKSKLAVQQSLEKLETLKKSLMQKYFG